MSSRLTYAAGGAALAEWVVQCWTDAPVKADGTRYEPDEAAIGYLAQWVADGNSVQAFCERYGLNWGVLAGWIRKSPERDAIYRQALVDRSAFRRERLLDGWWQTASAVVEDKVTHADVHKAREALAKADGMFAGEKAESGGGGGMPSKITIMFVDAKDGRPVENVVTSQ